MVMMQGTADATSVLRRFAAQLGVEEPPTERAPLIGMLYEQLAIVREDGRHVVLILDDAHTLGREAMAEIGGLMNLEYEDRRLMSLLLVGLPTLDAMISGIPSLGERVDVRVPLKPLGEADAHAYIAHRLQAAGGDASTSSTRPHAGPLQARRRTSAAHERAGRQRAVRGLSVGSQVRSEQRTSRVRVTTSPSKPVRRQGPAAAAHRVGRRQGTQDASRS